MYAPMPSIISTISACSLGSQIATRNGAAAGASGTPWSATSSQITWVPFTFTSAFLLTKLWFMASGSANNTTYIGIVNYNGYCIAAGSALAGNSLAVVEVDVTDVVIAPGQYFIGVVGTGSEVRSWRIDDTTNGSFDGLASMGVLRSAAATIAAGTTYTFAKFSNFANGTGLGAVPFVGASQRTLVA